MTGFNRGMKFLAAISGLAAMAGSAIAQITVVNTGSAVSAVADDPKTAVLSFNAGATANKLIVQVSAEGQDVDSITYQGVALTQAAAGTASGRNKGIFYLDNPFTGGAADLSVSLGVGISNGIAVGVVSVAGAAPGVAAAALADGARSVTLTVPVSGSFVVGGYAANGTGTITLPAGHTAIYNSTNIGSANAAASYANAQTAGSKTYSYTDTSHIAGDVCRGLRAGFRRPGDHGHQPGRRRSRRAAGRQSGGEFQRGGGGRQRQHRIVAVRRNLPDRILQCGHFPSNHHRGIHPHH